MKHVILSVAILSAFIGRPALTQQATLPLSKDQIMDLVRFGMDAAELVQKIKDLGTDFEPTDEYLAALRKAGAQEAVIQALRQKPKPLTKEQVGKLLMGASHHSGERRW